MKGPEATFHEFLRQGRFMLQRNRRSGAYIFYPRTSSMRGREDELEWVEATGRGIVYAATTIRRKSEHGGDYNISMVELAEGPRLMTRVLRVSPDKVAIGMAVVADIGPPSWNEKTDAPVVTFHPASEHSGGASNG